MISQMQEFVSDTSSALVDKVQKIRKESVESAREAAVGSAEKIKSLKGPVRTFARSGVKLTTVSQNTFASLIDLRADALTSALSELALRLEKAARAESIVELVRDRATYEPMAPYNGTSDEMAALGRFFREQGLYTFVRWNTFFTNPPLIVTEAQLDEGLAIVARGLEITDRAVKG